MTPKSLLDAWGSVEAKAATSTTGGYLHLQVLGGDLPIGVIIRAEDKRPGLLVRIQSKDLPKLPSTSSGRGFSLEKIVQFGAQSHGLPILLGDSSATDIFAMMGADLIAVVETSDGKTAAIELVLRRIALWRHFFQRRSGRMTDEEVRGLFGELHVFQMLLRAVGSDAAVAAWHGPDRELLDFHRPTHFIEAKTWRVDGGAKIAISHPNQLAVDANCPIYVAEMGAEGYPPWVSWR